MKEECGIFGYFAKHNAVTEARDALHKLQHRGQESCGLAVYNGIVFTVLTYMGLVLKNLTDSALKDCEGELIIGHTRYSTSGSSTLNNAQPFAVNTRHGIVAVAHNGNLTNTEKLKKPLQDKGAYFSSTSDTETILHLIAKSTQPNLLGAIMEALRQIEGSYSLVFLTKDSVIAARDPYGYRPLEIGTTKDGGYVFASETCAFFPCRASHIGEVKPGEIVVANNNGLSKYKFTDTAEICHTCIFEHVYLARPDSVISGRSVEFSREAAGALLAKNETLTGEYIVVGVPDSGLCSALGFARALNKGLSNGLIRSHFEVERSFIKPTDEERELVVKRKLSPNQVVITGQRLILVDDSLVRGTTSKIIIKMLKEAGAVEVHLRIPSPRIVFTCERGVDLPNRKHLIAVGRTDDEIAREIGADSVKYLELAELLTACGANDTLAYCRSCISNERPQLVQIAV